MGTQGVDDFYIRMKIRKFRFAWCFLATIIVFAVIFTFLGEEHWNAEHPVEDFWSALYFSVVSITTLGFGDMFPVSGIARVLVCAECILGLIFMGLFLNDISAAQAEKVSEIERGKNEEELRAKEIEKYKIRFRAMRRKLDMFLSNAYLLTTPMDKRDDEMPDDLINRHFTFNDLHDFNQPNLLVSQNYMEKTIEVFLRSEKKLYEDMTEILKTTDGDYLDGVHTLIEEIADDIDDNDFSEAILFQLKTKFKDGKSMADAASEIINNFKEGDEVVPTVLHYPYYCIYHMLLRVLPKIAELKERSTQLINSI